MLSEESRNRSTQLVRHVSVRPSSRADGLSGRHLSQHKSVNLFTCSLPVSHDHESLRLTWFWNCSFCCSCARNSCNSRSPPVTPSISRCERMTKEPMDWKTSCWSRRWTCGSRGSCPESLFPLKVIIDSFRSPSFRLVIREENG